MELPAAQMDRKPNGSAFSRCRPTWSWKAWNRRQRRRVDRRGSLQGKWRIAMLDSACTGGRCYYRTNWQGSTTHLINQDGSIRDTYHYGPYGERVDWSPQDADTGNPFRYTGRRYDPETGLYYYRARYYSPKLGRFLQADAAGTRDDQNLYAYVGGDSVNKIDPSGTDAVWMDNKDGTHTLVIPVTFHSLPGQAPADFAGKVQARARNVNLPPGYNIAVVTTSRAGVMNHLYLQKGGNPFECAGRGGCVTPAAGSRRGFIDIDSDTAVEDAFHEIMHYAGVQDAYHTTRERDDRGKEIVIPYPGFTEDNIMVNPKGSSLTEGQLKDAEANYSTKKCSYVTGSRGLKCEPK